MYPVVGERVNHESITGPDRVTGIMNGGALGDATALEGAGALGDRGTPSPSCAGAPWGAGAV